MKNTFCVLPNNNEDALKEAFDFYIKHPSEKALINIAILVLGDMLNKNNLGQIYLEIKKLNYSGVLNEESTCITINSSLFKKPKIHITLAYLIETLAHEVTHLMLEQQNKKILEEKSSGKYIPTINDKSTYDFFSEMFQGDLELVIFAQIYSYVLNENEFLARKHGHNQMVAYLDKYLPNQVFDFPSFETKEQFYKMAKFSEIDNFKMFKQLYYESIYKYQYDLLSKGLQNASEKEIKFFIFSTQLYFNDKAQEALLKNLCSCKNLELVKRVFETPVMQLSEQQIKTLEEVYGKVNLNGVLFEQSPKAQIKEKV